MLKILTNTLDYNINKFNKKSIQEIKIIKLLFNSVDEENINKIIKRVFPKETLEETKRYLWKRYGLPFKSQLPLETSHTQVIKEWGQKNQLLYTEDIKEGFIPYYEWEAPNVLEAKVDNNKKEHKKPQVPSKNITKNRFLTETQKNIQEHLLKKLKVLETRSELDLGLQPRCHTLIIGPTGVGKSHLIGAFAETQDLPLLRINLSNWLPEGSKSGNKSGSLKKIKNFISLKKKCIVFIDEIEKVTHDNEWSSAIRLELHEALDFAHKKQDSLSLIIGAGTYQEEYDKKGSKIGFLKKDPENYIDKSLLLNKLPREILQRFSEDVIYLETLSRKDYEYLIGQIKLNMANKEYTKKLTLAFENEASKNIDTAIKENLGVRYLETCLTKAIEKNEL